MNESVCYLSNQGGEKLKGINVEVTLRAPLTTSAARPLGRGTGPATVRRPGSQADRNSIPAMMF